MSLLDTFTILFEADISSVELGANRSRQSSDELVDSLKQADKQADKTGESYAGFAAKAVGMLTAVLSVGQGISATIDKAAEIAQIAQTADAIGVAVEDLDAFGRAAAAAGGDAEGARDSVTDMAEAMGEALADVESGRAQAFGALGISLRGVDGQAKDAISGILDLAGAVEGMSRSEAVFKIKELGITDNRTVELVLKGRKELERMLAVQKEQGGITDENAEQAIRFTEGMNKLRNSLDSAGTGFMSALIPALTLAVEWLTRVVDWAGEHSHVIVGFFGAVAAIVTAMYLPAMISAAAATLAATWPIIAIGAAIAAVAAAFALAYDDIMNFIEGNDSFIGQIFEKYPLVKDLVFGLINAFKTMGSAIAAVFKFIAAIWKAQFDFIMAGIEKVRSGVLTVAKFFGFGGGDDVEAGQQALAQANASPLNATTSNSISNSVASSRETNVQVGEVIVQTQATDANGIARDVGGSLDSQLKQMNNEFADGVER